MLRLFVLLANVSIQTPAPPPAADVQAGQEGKEVVIRLHESPRDSEEPWGMTNLFFSDDTTARRRFRRLPVAAELAGVVEAAGLRPVYAMRERDRTGAWRYRVDTNANGDFSDEAPLRFEARGNMLVADFEALMRPVEGTGRQGKRVSLQVLVTSDGRYVYARPVRAFVGVWRLKDRMLPIRVRPQSRNDVPGRAVDRFTVAVDLDGDGAYRSRRSPTGAVSAAPVEEVGDAPFRTGSEVWQIVGVNLEARVVRIVSVPDSIRAVAETFAAPALPTRPLELDPWTTDLIESAGDSVTVLEFWSINCPWSEQARPELNRLVAGYRGKGIRWIAIPRESNGAAVREFLKEHPREARSLLVDSGTWNIWNPSTTTPMFIVIDPGGRIAFRGYGATAVPLIRRTLDEVEMSRTERRGGDTRPPIRAMR